MSTDVEIKNDYPIEYRHRDELKIHPDNLKIYEEMSEQDKRNMADSIRRNGILEPLVIDSKNTIFSGMRRYIGGSEAGTQYFPVRVRKINKDEDESEILIEYNNQRVKTPGEILREAAILREIFGKRNVQGRTSDAIAQRVSGGRISGRTLERMEYIRDHAPESIKKKVDSGELSVNQGYDAAVEIQKQPQEQRDKIKQKIDSGKTGIKQAINEVKAETNKDLETKLKDVDFGDTKFGTIIVFPHWDISDLGFTNYGSEEWGLGLPEPVTSEFLAEMEISGQPIPSLLDEKGHVYLVCPPKACELAFDVMRSWGLEVGANLAWVANNDPIMKVPSIYAEKYMNIVMGSTFESHVQTHPKNWFYADFNHDDPMMLPDVLVSMIEKVSPGPRLVIFGKTYRQGWYKVMCDGRRKKG